MRKTHILSLLLGAALISSSGAVAMAQDAAANASGKAAARSEAKADKAAPEATAASASEARATAEDSTEIKRGLASLKSGTAISTELDKTIDAGSAKPGDIVSAKVTKDVKQKGHTVIRKGDRLLGHVTSADAGAKGEAGSELAVTFDRLARGDAEYQLKTVVSSVITTSGDLGGGMQISPLDDGMMMPRPVGAGEGGGRAGGGGLLGGATSTTGSAVSATGSAAGGLVRNVDGTASSALGSTGANVAASEHGSAQSSNGVGLSTPLRDVRLNSQTSASQNGEATSVIAARRGNLRLESGSRMQFKVANQTEAEAAKK